MTTADSAAGGSFFSQPRAVWAVAFAAVVSFMGLGLSNAHVAVTGTS
jgi:hypothetical protein